MSDATSASSGPGLRPLLAIAAVFGVLVAVTVGLWAYYGTAVFVQVVLSGLAACF
jgi:hypothetical protein